MTTIDINADTGESYGRWKLGDDDAMFEFISSANVACGFHAGDPLTLRTVCASAVDSGVVIGAQVGYPDLAGFGRRFIDMDPDELTAAVIYQIGALDGLARAAGGRVRYVKPHGALYNTVVHHQKQARAVVDAVLAYDADLPLLGLPGSTILHIAEDLGLRAVREAFADRAYTADGGLVDRRVPGAVLHDPEVVAGRVVRLAVEGWVEAFDGTDLACEVDSICLHGDTAGAVGLASAARKALADAQVDVEPFVRIQRADRD
jgi:UPF0271 protein